MKNIRIEGEKTKIKREHIIAFGETVYNDSLVEGIKIDVVFKDGSNIGFKRHERKDNIDRFEEELEDDE